MGRILSVLAVMVMILALTAGPALAQTDIPPPGPGIPGNAQSPSTNPTNFPAGPTGAPDQARNCYGQSQFTGFAGPGTPFPGSAAQPVEFGGQLNFSGPAHKQFLQTDTTPGGGNPISDFQQTAREQTAATNQC